VFDFLQRAARDLWSMPPGSGPPVGARPPLPNPYAIPPELHAEPDDVARPGRKPLADGEYAAFQADFAADREKTKQNQERRFGAEEADPELEARNRARDRELYTGMREEGFALDHGELWGALDMPPADMSELDELTKVNGLEERRLGIADKWNAAAGQMGQTERGRVAIEQLMTHATGPEGKGTGMPRIGDSTVYGRALGVWDPREALVHLLVGEGRSAEDVGGTAVHEAYHAEHAKAQTHVEQGDGEDWDDYRDRVREAKLIHEGRARVAAMLYHDEHLGRIEAGGEGDAGAHREAMNGQTLTREGEDNVVHGHYFAELAAEQARLLAKDPTMTKEKAAAAAREHAEISAARLMIPRMREIGY
jgi:hypothetical protein